MSEIKNRIITISGEPASGKSTVLNKLKEDYEANGYKVHIFLVGHEFRRIAQEKGLSIEEFNEYMKKRGNIDELIDSTVKKRGEEINSKERPGEIYIFDSRLAFHNIPASFSIRLTVGDNVAGKRVFGDNKRGKEDSYTTLQEAIAATRSRKKGEIERYKQRYGINLEDTDNYNLVIDTSFARVEDISQVIAQCLELELQGKSYGKMWNSPKQLLPLQGELATYGSGFGSGLTFEDLLEKIKEEGYKPDSAIEVVNVDGRLYIIEGHHRNFVAGYIGKSLVPYCVLAKDDEIIPGYSNTARQRAESLKPGYLYGHEEFLDNKDGGDTFSYSEVYPGIYDELTRKAPEEDMMK